MYKTIFLYIPIIYFVNKKLLTLLYMRVILKWVITLNLILYKVRYIQNGKQGF